MSKYLNVLITSSAKADIVNIINYIANDNPDAALKVNNAFRKTFEMLRDFPSSGTIKSVIKDKSVRVYTIRKQFSIIYRVKLQNLEVLRVLTKYQDIFAIF